MAWNVIGSIDSFPNDGGHWGAYDDEDRVYFYPDQTNQLVRVVDTQDYTNPVELTPLDLSGREGKDPRWMMIDRTNKRVFVVAYTTDGESDGVISLWDYSDKTAITFIDELRRGVFSSIDADYWMFPTHGSLFHQLDIPGDQLFLGSSRGSDSYEGWDIVSYQSGTLNAERHEEPGDTEKPIYWSGYDPVNDLFVAPDWLGDEAYFIYDTSSSYTPTLLHQASMTSTSERPRSVLPDPDRNLWFIMDDNDAVLRVYEWDAATPSFQQVHSLSDAAFSGIGNAQFTLNRNNLIATVSDEVFVIDVADPANMSITNRQTSWPSYAGAMTKLMGLQQADNGEKAVLVDESENYLVVVDTGVVVDTNKAPDKPTCNVDSVDQREADLSSSAFSDPDGDPHDSSRWQVRDQGDADWSTPEYDSGWTASDLTTHTTDRVLTPGADYEARVAHRDPNGAFTWSDPVAFTTETLERVQAIGPEGFFFGGAGRNDLLEFGSVHEDAGAPIRGELLHRAVAPMGALGEHLYRYVRVTITYATELSLTVTPVLDGEELTTEAEVFTRPEPNTQQTETLEVELGRSLSSTRPGLRGTWFRTLLELQETAGRAGFIAVDGIELEWEPVREHTAGLTFHQESLQTPNLPRVARFMFGAGDAVGEFGTARDDLGSEVEAILHSNPVGPAGSGGEAIFTNLYLALTRANPTDLPLNVQAIVDETAYTVATLTLEGVTDPVLEVVEVPLTTDILRGGVPVGRRHLRGSWCEIELDTDGLLPDGDIIFETAELEWEPVQESEGAPVG